MGKPSLDDTLVTVDAQLVLRALEPTLRLLDDAVMVTTADLDAPGPAIAYVNPAFTRLTGYPPEEVIGQSPRLLQGPKTDPRVLTRLRGDLEARRFFKGEVINYRKDGSDFLLEWQIAPLLDGSGGVRFWLALQRDITGRRAFEAEIHAQRDWLTMLIDAIPDAVCCKDGNGRWLVANRVTIALVNLHGIDYRGRTDAELAELVPAHAEAFLRCAASDQQAWQAGEETFRDQLSIDPNGREKLLDIRKVPLFHEDGRRKGIIIVGRDVTGRRTAEDALRLKAMELEAVMTAVPAAVWIAHDPECRRITGSPFAHELLRVPLGGNLSKTAPEVERPQHFKVLKDGRELAPEDLPVQTAEFFLSLNLATAEQMGMEIPESILQRASFVVYPP